MRNARDQDRPAERAQDDHRRRALAAARRRAGLRAAEPIDVERDPFAEGHEDRTPPELYAVRPGGGPVADSPGWTVRVVPNLYPALTPADPAGRDGDGPTKSGIVETGDAGRSRSCSPRCRRRARTR